VYTLVKISISINKKDVKDKKYISINKEGYKKTIRVACRGFELGRESVPSQSRRARRRRKRRAGWGKIGTAATTEPKGNGRGVHSIQGLDFRGGQFFSFSSPSER